MGAFGLAQGASLDPWGQRAEWPGSTACVYTEAGSEQLGDSCPAGVVFGLSPHLDTLAASAGDSSSRLRCALFWRKGLTALFCDADLRTGVIALTEAHRVAASSGATSLSVHCTALLALMRALGGEMTRADVQLDDASFAIHFKTADPAARLLLRGCAALVKLLLGCSTKALDLVTTATSEPTAAQTASEHDLLLECHRLYAAACLGCSELAAEVSCRVGMLDAGLANGFLHCYRHFGLAALALHDGCALRALVHAEQCEHLGERCGCRLPLLLAAMLRLQALGDLRRFSEADAVYELWYRRWVELGWLRVAAAAKLELVRTDALRGNLDHARIRRDDALHLLPVGEALLPLHRPRGWLDELNSLLAGTSSTPRVLIRTLGEFTVEVDGNRIYDRIWQGALGKSLLTALISRGGQKVPTEELADLLWPDSDGARAQQNLKVALSRLRRLGSSSPVGWIHVKHHRVSLSASMCRVDAHDFAAAIRPLLARGNADLAALTETCRLYAGDFLPSEHACPWVAAYRRQLRELFERAQAILRSGGDRRRAIAVASASV